MQVQKFSSKTEDEYFEPVQVKLKQEGSEADLDSKTEVVAEHDKSRGKKSFMLEQGQYTVG